MEQTGEHIEPTHSLIPIINRTTTTNAITSTSSWANTNVTQTSVEKITYQCDRQFNLCGCSLNNVVLSSYNEAQSSSSVIDSENVYSFSWTMMVSIRTNADEHICSGTILSDFFILTAAHCVYEIDDYKILDIVVALDSLSNIIISKQQIEKIFIHENYTDEENYIHDIALIQLDQRLELDTQPSFSRACLPNPHPTMHSQLIVVGWKSSGIDDDSRNVLQQISVKSIDDQHQSCSQLIQNNFFQFCAGLIQNPKSNDRSNQIIQFLLYFHKSF